MCQSNIDMTLPLLVYLLPVVPQINVTQTPKCLNGENVIRLIRPPSFNALGISSGNHMGTSSWNRMPLIGAFCGSHDVSRLLFSYAVLYATPSETFESEQYF